MSSRFISARHTGLSGCIVLLLSAGTVSADGVQARVANDSTQDVLVTVYDTSVQPRRVIVSNQRINGFTSVPINLRLDATGKATVAWTATSVDSTSPRCGHEDNVRLGSDASFSVHANDICGA